MSKVFVGRISNRVSDQELSDIFSKYGKVSHVHMKQNFAFVHMESPASAQDAIKELNGTQIAGDTITVELAKSELEGGPSAGMRRPSFRRFEGERYPDADRPRPYRGDPYGRNDRFESRERFEGASRGRYDYPPPRDRYDSRGPASHYLDEREHSHRSGGLPPPPSSGSSYDLAPPGNLRMDREMRVPRSDDYYPPPSNIDYRSGDGYHRRRGYSPPPGGYERPPPPPPGQNIRYPPEDGRFDYPRPYGNRSGDYGHPPPPSSRHTSEYPRRDDPAFARRPPLGCFECGRPDHKAALCPSRRGGSGPDDDNSRRLRENRSRSPSRFDRPRSPPTSSRYEQANSGSQSSDAQRSPMGWGQVPTSPGRKTNNSFNNDDVRSPSPVAQYYEDM